MKYEQNNSAGSNYPYPNHDIDPDKKDAAWCMAYAKAAYFDWNGTAFPKGIFANNNGDYEKFKMYALAKQPISPYKSLLGVDAQTNNTWLSVDWSVRSIIPLFRNKAISRLMERDYGIVATPIDITAKAELDKYYAEAKAKLAVRQLIQQTNEQIASHPLISLQPDEPSDIEELEMRIELGEQFNRAKDAEQAIELGFYENDYQNFRKAVYEDLFDLGIAGYKEWLGDDNKAKFRKVDVSCAVTNFCKDLTKDLIHAGEQIDVSLIDLATKCDKEGNRLFTDEELQEFASSLCGKMGNPRMLSLGGGFLKPYDKFKCKVLDIEFFSYDEHVWRKDADANGNMRYTKEDWGRGKKSIKYDRKRFQVVYKCKWIIGTDKCYDWGLATDRKTSVNEKKKAQTSLSYKFIAYNFFEMKATGFMEQLIPLADEYQLTKLKIQNFKNRAVPSGWFLSLDMLENVALSKGGKNMEPKEIIQMFFETGVLVGRTLDASGQPMFQSGKPVEPIPNTAASELAMLYQDLLNVIGEIQRITGHNDVTMGDANPKMLVPGIEEAQVSTNHALFPIKFAEKYLTEKLAEDVLVRMSQGVKKGEVTGYAPYKNALSKNTLTFIKVSPTIAIREYGIKLEERSTEQERIWLLEQMKPDIANGYLSTADVIMVIYAHNTKQSWLILSQRSKKAKELAHRRQQELVQMQTQGNMQVAQAAEAAKLEGQRLEIMGRLEEKKMETFKELEKERMRMENEYRIAVLNNTTKLQVAEGSDDSRLAASIVQGQTKIEAQAISSEFDLEKQRIANQKQKSSSAK